MHPVVEQAIALYWHDSPQAAAMSRTYARSMEREGRTADYIAKAISNHGEVI